MSKDQEETIEISERQLQELISTNKQLRSQRDELRTDLFKMIDAVGEVQNTFDFSSPMKVMSKIGGMISQATRKDKDGTSQPNPLFAPLVEVIEKYVSTDGQ